MAHLQGNKPSDDPNKFGLKFDSEKPRWELLPKIELMNIVKIFDFFLYEGKCKALDLDLMNFDRKKLINDIFQDIFLWDAGQKEILIKGFPIVNRMTFIAFRIFLLLRKKPYVKEDFKSDKYQFRWNLLDLNDVEKVVDVFTMGAKKYADNNWKQVSPERYYGALCRHFITINTVHRYDSELGCLHLHQAAWNAIALMWIENQIPESIKKAASKIQKAPLIKVKPVKKKVAKKVKKKPIKKKK